jgi:hypothetical protein
MKNFSLARARVVRLLSVMFAASLLAGPISSFAARAQATAQTPAPSAAPQPSAEEAAKRKAWRATIARTPAPQKGCFTASYPKTEWQEVPCGEPSPFPNPARRPRPDAVGDTIDYSAQASGLISSAVGSFASVTPATITESGQILTQQGCPPPICPPNHPNCIPMNPSSGGGTWCIETKDDAFSLQVNSQFFELNAPFQLSSQASQIMACLNRTAACGWEQFVFVQYGCPQGPCVFIQYWLLDYGTTSPPPPSACATAWMQGETGSTDWYCNSSSTIVPHVSAAQLQGITLTGTATAGGDQAVLTIGDVAFMTEPAADSMLNLAQHWNAVEWNVVGDCCGFDAAFQPTGSTIVVNTNVNAGATATCVQEGFTGETNNLSLVGTPPGLSSTPPAIVFQQSNGGGSPASCIFAGLPGPPVPPGKQHGGPGPACGHGHLPPCRKP